MAKDWYVLTGRANMLGACLRQNTTLLQQASEGIILPIIVDLFESRGADTCIGKSAIMRDNLISMALVSCETASLCENLKANACNFCRSIVGGKVHTLCCLRPTTLMKYKAPFSKFYSPSLLFAT